MTVGRVGDLVGRQLEPHCGADAVCGPTANRLSGRTDWATFDSFGVKDS